MKRRLKLYLTALNRYKRSRGFGIHSPFAFSFVLRVLRESTPYYAYSDIRDRRSLAASLMQRTRGRRLKLMSTKEAKMLFRIVCRLRPTLMVEVGTSYGLGATTMLDVSSASRLIAYPGASAGDNVFATLTADVRNRITECATLAEAKRLYFATAESATDSTAAKGTTPSGPEALTPDAPLILVNTIDSEADITPCAEIIADTLARGGTVVLRNLMRSPLMELLTARVAASMTHGMAFTNSRTAVIVGLRHLPLQRYNLWF